LILSFHSIIWHIIFGTPKEKENVVTLGEDISLAILEFVDRYNQRECRVTLGEDISLAILVFIDRPVLKSNIHVHVLCCVEC